MSLTIYAAKFEQTIIHQHVLCRIKNNQQRPLIVNRSYCKLTSQKLMVYDCKTTRIIKIAVLFYLDIKYTGARGTDPPPLFFSNLMLT